MSEVLEAAWWGEASRRAGRVTRPVATMVGRAAPSPPHVCLSVLALPRGALPCCLSACAAHRPNRASPCAERAVAAVRALHNRKIAFGRVLLAPPSLFAKAARLAGSMRRAVGTSAGCGSRRRCARGPRDLSALVCAIRLACAAGRLVGIPPVAPRERNRGVLRIQASSRAPVRIRAASPLARWRHMPAVTAQALPLAPTHEPHARDAHSWRTGGSRPVATVAAVAGRPPYHGAP